MTNLLARGHATLVGKMKAHHAEAVTYGRGEDSVLLDASPGKVGNPADNAQGIILPEAAADWYVSVADLLLDGTATEPQPGDTIGHTDAGGVARTYRVTPLAAGEACFRLIESGLRYCIHTVRVEA